MDPFLGEIKMFAGNFPPRGWAFCQGQIMSIASNNALFALLGTQYGGDGQTTFALPDLRGRAPIGFGTGPGLPNIVQGQAAGANTVTLLSTNAPGQQVTIPVQTISVSIPAVEGDANAPAPSPANVLAKPYDTSGSGAAADIYSSAAANTNLKPFDVTVPQHTVLVGGNPQPFSVQNPYLGINFIIALEGIYPSRN
ncbi:phage tail protein [Pseudomonas sp. PSKL.D1]|uniref:phage tail protein n=1 Tax=Pseudomonas sp. PSKL.D1 TaxID=3029060 RepID=UPI0023815131|nr:tail fiber protein [Pseudomonas sp. PSKL.D1]WDY55826.1 tail fiber protein [Pseudomonas sp. PSKL.D1]